MMDGLVTSHDYIGTAANGEGVLYKLCKERSTVGDNARCHAIQCYLNMCQYHYKLIECTNADAMSPSRMAPFLIVPTDNGDIILSTFRAITSYIEAQDKGLTSVQESTDKAQLNAISSLINNIVIAEQYYTWIHYQTYKHRTMVTVGVDKAWPLNVVIPTIDRMGFIWNNFALYRTEESQVVDQYVQSLWSLSQLLGEDNNSFSLSGKCSVDALVYGHIEAIRNSGITQLSAPLQEYPKLIQFTDTVKHEHFNIGMVVN